MSNWPLDDAVRRSGSIVSQDINPAQLTSAPLHRPNDPLFCGDGTRTTVYQSVPLVFFSLPDVQFQYSNVQVWARSPHNPWWYPAYFSVNENEYFVEYLDATATGNSGADVAVPLIVLEYHPNDWYINSDLKYWRVWVLNNGRFVSGDTSSTGWYCLTYFSDKDESRGWTRDTPQIGYDDPSSNFGVDVGGDVYGGSFDWNTIAWILYSHGVCSNPPQWGRGDSLSYNAAIAKAYVLQCLTNMINGLSVPSLPQLPQVPPVPPIPSVPSFGTITTKNYGTIPYDNAMEPYIWLDNNVSMCPAYRGNLDPNNLGAPSPNACVIGAKELDYVPPRLKVYPNRAPSSWANDVITLELRFLPDTRYYTFKDVTQGDSLCNWSDLSCCVNSFQNRIGLNRYPLNGLPPIAVDLSGPCGVTFQSNSPYSGTLEVTLINTTKMVAGRGYWLYSGSVSPNIGGFGALNYYCPVTCPN